MALTISVNGKKVPLYSRKGNIAPLFCMQLNWYRGIISTKCRVDKVDFKAEFAPNKENFEGLPLILSVYDSISNKVCEIEHILPSNNVPRELRLLVPLEKSLGAGEYRLTGVITFPIEPKQKKPKTLESSTYFKILASRPAQVIPDDDGTLIEAGKPFFPIGIYYVRCEDYQAIDDLGFNSVQFWNWQIGGWYSHIPTGYYAAGSYDFRCLMEAMGNQSREMKETLRDGVSTLGWYVADEPDENALSGIEHWNNYWHDFDENHPTYICSCRPDLFHIHQKYCDILSFDPGGKRYKTYHEAVVGWIKTAQEATQGHKTLFITPGCGNKREDANFYRAVTYLALVHNVRGIMWYCWSQQGGGPLGVGLKVNETPGVREKFKELNSEVRFMMPGLLAVNRRPFELGAVHGMFCGDGTRNNNFLILVNSTDQPASCDFTLPELEQWNNFKVKDCFSPENTPVIRNGATRVDGRTRRLDVNEQQITIHKGQITHDFGPYETLVYHW